ncbi:major capsid protein [Bacteroides reticulotermitis]|uniref:major capsid protein n=1 Tax=Bacteroides reticulotermitis TaxID=1133319 RepID=UPI00130E0032|nr:major capsid protein [Bacteroides reticulotermitis]
MVAKGLASLGYTGNGALQAYIQDMFAIKYNAEAIYSQMGFPINPNVPINPTYEQIEGALRVYTMATYVDIDSDGPTKSTDGVTLKQGGLPIFKHEVVLSRKTIKEKMMLADAIGGSTSDIESVIMELLFSGLDDLLGGNYNTMRYQRHQIVSNFGKLDINANNNPLGTPMTIDFSVPAKNKKTSKWFTIDANGNVTQDADVGVSVDPIKIMKDTKRNAEDNDFAPQGHWEVNKATFDAFIELPYIRTMYSVAVRPDITDAGNQLAFANMQADSTIKSWIEARIGARIDVIDAISSIEKFDKANKISYTNVRSFNNGVFVYVPDGAIGDVQFGKPIYMETPGARVALYDGGRTLIRQVFNDETMTQVVKSEVTGLVVPNKTRWFYYLTVQG